MEHLLEPFLDAEGTIEPLEVAGFVLFLLVFPVYHAVYPSLVRLFPHRTAKGHIDKFRRSWIEGIIARRDLTAVAQQTRNLTMINSLLASSALILLGFTVNIVLRFPVIGEGSAHVESWAQKPGATEKLYLLILVFALAFSYFMAALRHLGHFNVVIGAEPEVVDREEGSSVDYFTLLIDRASKRYTLGVRCFFASFPLFVWVLNSWLFIALTLFFGIKFVGFQDFGHVLRRLR